MEIDKIIKYVETYGKTKSSHGISREVKASIIQLHDQLIPMDVKLFKPHASDCGSCLNKALARFVINLDTLLQYRDSIKPAKEDRPAQPKKRRGRPRKKK